MVVIGDGFCCINKFEMVWRWDVEVEEEEEEEES